MSGGYAYFHSCSILTGEYGSVVCYSESCNYEFIYSDFISSQASHRHNKTCIYGMKYPPNMF